MAGHTDRAHALLSASGAHRWLSCPPSALLEQQFPDTASEAAAEGTLAHELAEAMARNYVDTVNFGKRKLTAAVNKLKKSPLWQDEMMRHVDIYVDYIKTTALGFPSTPFVALEKQVDLTGYIPGGFGTADCIIVCGGVLQVVDFKYGKGVPVTAKENPQMMLYALGAYGIYRLWYPIREIRMAIVQPRLDILSEWSCGLEELLRFGEYVKERAALAIKGEGEYHPDSQTCRFCRARAQCRARAKENVQLAFFTDRKPPLISGAEVGEFLRQGEDVAKWLKELQEWALAECLAGREVPGWKAVEGRGSRDWTDMDAAFELLQRSGVSHAMLFEEKPLTLAQVEKLLGKKEFEQAVGSYVVKRPGKPALVQESDKREAITNKVTAKQAFGGDDGC